MLLCGILIIPMMLMAQKEKPWPSQSTHQVRKAGFYEEIRRENRDTVKSLPPGRFVVDFKNFEFPSDTSLYHVIKHLPPVSQGETGTCWCFAATSFLEAEIMRQQGKPVKLSEMFFVYHEYLDRAEAFVKSRGNISFSEGSESSSVPILLSKYGAMPAEAYSGKAFGKTFHHHRIMVDEMQQYLKWVKLNAFWDAEAVKACIKSILDHHIGAPPKEFNYINKIYTAISFSEEVVKLHPFSFFNFMSNIRQPQNARAELVEDDNWRRFDGYYNLPLNDFMSNIVSALENGYSICICGDISEPGYNSENGAAIIPVFDIPSSAIDAHAREYRLENGSTTDDHCIHLVGYTVYKNHKWFLAKDSGAGAFDCPVKGYRYLHEDFVKLKMMNTLMHGDAARPILDRIIK